MCSLRPAFGASQAGRQALYRWQRDLPAAQRCRLSGVAHVHAQARLPNDLTVRAFLATGSPDRLVSHRLPPGHESWSDKDRQRFIDTHQLLRYWQEFRAAHGGRNETALAPLFTAHQVPCGTGFQPVRLWSRQRHLSCHPRRLREYRRRLDPTSAVFDGNVDRRGHKSPFSNPQSSIVSPAAWELLLSIYLHENQLSLAECHRFVAGEALEHGWDWPSVATVARLVDAEIPKPAQILYRKGQRRFAADCEPKIKRDYEQIAAGQWWSLDGRTLDIMARTPDSRSNWRRARFVVTGVLDMRSRMLIGWDLRAHEHSDGILAGVKMALRDYGAPEHVHYDCGEAYKAALGTPRGSKKQKAYFDDERVGSVFAQLGVQVHNSIPYSAWSKQIESIWAKLKRGFDAWFWSYWGGAPNERPERADRLTKRRIDQLPTAEDLREAFAIFLDEYHSAEQSGDGTLGLCPKLVMEQYRGPIRRVDPALVDLVCCRTVGGDPRHPIKAGRDGIRHNKLLYRLSVDDLVKYQGRRVTLRIEPERLDRLIVCDDQGRPLCIAKQDKLRGTSQEDLREAARERARMRKAAKAYAPARDFLLETPTTQILTMKRRHAQARAAEQRKQLPDPEQPVVQLVRPDLVKAAKQLERQAPSVPGCPVASLPSPAPTSFDRLADSLNAGGDSAPARPDSWQRHADALAMARQGDEPEDNIWEHYSEAAG